MVFHNILNAKFPWAKLILGLDGKVHQVRCKICSKIEGIEKKLSLKLDSLWKHDNRKQALIAILNVYKVGEFYMNKSFGLSKNEHLYANVRKDIIVH